MLDADLPEFTRIVNGLAAIKPGKPLTPEGLMMFWSAMQSWSIEDFRSAAAELALTSEFMPNPYHFEQLRKAGRATVGEAWLIARRSAGSCYVGGAIGYGDGGTSGDPLIDRAVRAIGGFRAIAMCDSDKLGFLERRFAEHYETMQDAQDTRVVLPQIAGPQSERVTGPRPMADILRLPVRE